MSTGDDRLYLEHIRDAIAKIEKYLADTDFEKFTKNDMMVDAVIRELAIVGEAANHLSTCFQAAHPDIPFRDIVDMRNILVHNYAGVSEKIVWTTCKHNLPDLKECVRRSLMP